MPSGWGTIAVQQFHKAKTFVRKTKNNFAEGREQKPQ
jgi:hypothetical protein